MTIRQQKRFDRKWVPEPNSGCFLWIGATLNGYGRFTATGENTHRAHRLAWERCNGAIPVGLTIDHLCRTRCCVNPAHMEVVTRAENSKRGWRVGVFRRGPHNTRRPTHCKQGHAFTTENTRMEPVGRSGYWQRRCVACARAKARAYYARKHPKKGGA